MTSKSFLSMAMAAIIAVTSVGMTAAPARADNDTAKIIVGAAALGIIAAAIADAHDNDRVYVTRQHNYYYYPRRPCYVRNPRYVCKNRTIRRLRHRLHYYHRHNPYPGRGYYPEHR